MCSWNYGFVVTGNILRCDNEVDEAVIVVLADDSVLVIEACVM